MQELIDLSIAIVKNQSEHNVTIYAIQNKHTKSFISHKGRTFYTTRTDARSVRRSIENPALRVVKADFVNASDWKTSK